MILHLIPEHLFQKQALRVGLSSPSHIIVKDWDGLKARWENTKIPLSADWVSDQIVYCHQYQSLLNNLKNSVEWEKVTSSHTAQFIKNGLDIEIEKAKYLAETLVSQGIARISKKRWGIFKESAAHRYDILAKKLIKLEEYSKKIYCAEPWDVLEKKFKIQNWPSDEKIFIKTYAVAMGLVQHPIFNDLPLFPSWIHGLQENALKEMIDLGEQKTIKESAENSSSNFLTSHFGPYKSSRRLTALNNSTVLDLLPILKEKLQVCRADAADALQFKYYPSSQPVTKNPKEILLSTIMDSTNQVCGWIGELEKIGSPWLGFAKLWGFKAMKSLGADLFLPPLMIGKYDKSKDLVRSNVNYKVFWDERKASVLEQSDPGFFLDLYQRQGAFLSYWPGDIQKKWIEVVWNFMSRLSAEAGKEICDLWCSFGQESTLIWKDLTINPDSIELSNIRNRAVKSIGVAELIGQALFFNKPIKTTQNYQEVFLFLDKMLSGEESGDLFIAHFQFVQKSRLGFCNTAHEIKAILASYLDHWIILSMEKMISLNYNQDKKIQFYENKAFTDHLQRFLKDSLIQVGTESFGPLLDFSLTERKFMYAIHVSTQLKVRWEKEKWLESALHNFNVGFSGRRFFEESKFALWESMIESSTHEWSSFGIKWSLEDWIKAGVDSGLLSSIEARDFVKKSKNSVLHPPVSEKNSSFHSLRENFKR